MNRCVSHSTLHVTVTLTLTVMAVFKVDDTYHFFEAMCYLNLILYLCVCVDFRSVYTRVPFAANLGLLLLWLVENWTRSDVEGEAILVRGIGYNGMIWFSFTSFFYVLMDKLWASVFLLLGLLFINPVWEGIRLQIEDFLWRTLRYTVDASQHSYIWAATLMLLVFVGVVGFFSQSRYLSALLVASSYSSKAVSAMKNFAYSHGHIVCSVETGSDECPFWFSINEWFALALLTLFRLMLLYYVLRKDSALRCCNPKEYNAITQEEEDTDDNDTELADTSEQPGQQETYSKRK